MQEQRRNNLELASNPTNSESTAKEVEHQFCPPKFFQINVM
jgi:hypothetical protein